MRQRELSLNVSSRCVWPVSGGILEAQSIESTPFCRLPDRILVVGIVLEVVERCASVGNR